MSWLMSSNLMAATHHLNCTSSRRAEMIASSLYDAFGVFGITLPEKFGIFRSSSQEMVSIFSNAS
jgi:hypothetical protein